MHACFGAKKLTSFFPHAAVAHDDQQLISFFKPWLIIASDGRCIEFFLTIAVNVLSKASNNIFSLFCGRACNFGEGGAREKVPGVAGLNEAGPSRRRPVAAW